jgi:hypothetical protein
MANDTHPPNERDKHFYPCRNPNTLPQIFVKEAKIVRRSLIQDQPFRPLLAMPFDQTVAGLAARSCPTWAAGADHAQAGFLVPITRKSDKGTDPVLAYWNVGMGKMAVSPAATWLKWGAEWSGWERNGKFWSQIVRWAARQAGRPASTSSPAWTGAAAKSPSRPSTRRLLPQ